MSKSTPEQLRSPQVAGFTVRGDFDGGALWSDFGPMILRGWIAQYSGLKYSADESDAPWLAKLLRLGLLLEGYIYPKKQRAVRDLLRRGSRLVQQHSANVLAVQNLFSRNRGRPPTNNQIKRLTAEAPSELLPDANLLLTQQKNAIAALALKRRLGVS
jgi:hypothetical protein